MVVNYEEKVKERFLENYLFLRENAPAMMKKIQQEGGTDWRIVVGEDGSINALINGEPLYPYDPRKLAKDQVEELMKDPKRIVAPPPLISFRSKLVHSKYYSALSDLDGEVSVSSYIYDRKNIPVMIVFGMGFGYHISELVRRFNIQHMIVVEPNPDLFKLSLYAVDWKEIFYHFKKEGRSFNVIIGDDETKVRKEINRKFSIVSPAFTSYIFIFEHFSSPLFEKIKEWIVTEFVESPLLWGFFDDELWSLEHTVGNIRNAVPVFYGGRKIDTDVPVFVVGSGPSLDSAIEAIRTFADRAIVVSCGTALGALYRAGIKPDIHVEIERTEIVYKTLSEIDRRFLKEIPIVGMNTLFPRVFKLGKRGYMFLKPNDTGASIFPHTLPRIFNSNPTVTAGAVALMANAGFRKFYLFGVDLGSKAQDRHHSKFSGYYDEKSVLSKMSPSFDRTVEGNFGGTVFTNAVFYFTKFAIESSIKEFGLEVYNTSDGARITGAEALLPEEVSVYTSASKDSVLSLFFTNFRDSYRRDVNLEKTFRELKEDLDLYIKEFTPRLSVPSAKVEDIIQLFSDMHFYLLALGLNRKTTGEYPLKNLIGASLYQFQRLILRSAFTRGSEEDRQSYIQKAYALLNDFLREARSELDRVLR